MKVVINKCYGGFELSVEALEWLYEHKADCVELYQCTEFFQNVKEIKECIEKYEDFKQNPKPIRERPWNLVALTPDKLNVICFKDNDEKNRSDPTLIKCVETLKEKSFGSHAKLEIINIPDDIDFEIDEYDGIESIHEKHRSWG